MSGAVFREESARWISHFARPALCPKGFLLSGLLLSLIGSLYGFDHGSSTVHARRAVFSRGKFTADIFAERPICRFPGAALICG